MRACVYEGKGNIAVKDVNKPKSPKGGVIAKILCASICGTDLRTFRYGSEKLTVPRIIGHEACYSLEEGINGFEKSQRVIVAPAIGCGKCKSCRRGHTNMCDFLQTIGFQYDGTFAEYCEIPAQAFQMNNIIAVPDDVSDTQACVAEPVACAINAQSFLNIQHGDNVLIYGAGFLGCMHAELALLKGADKVIVADISPKRRAQTLALLNNVIVLDAGDKAFVKNVKEISAGDGIDVIITACPAGVTHKQALELVYKNGRISLFGGLPGDSNGYLDSNLIHYKEAGIFGVHASTPAQNREALSLIAAGKLDVDKYITTYSLDDITQAFEDLVNEDTIKALLME